jgi:endothelin-converting enzyme
MRPDQGSVFAGTLMAENAQMKLRHILEAPEAPEEQTLSSADKDNFKKLKSAYNACINVDALKRRGSEPLEAILKNIEIIYSSHGKHSERNLTDALLYLMQTDVSALIDFSISVRPSTVTFQTF